MTQNKMVRCCAGVTPCGTVYRLTAAHCTACCHGQMPVYEHQLGQAYQARHTGEALPAQAARAPAVARMAFSAQAARRPTRGKPSLLRTRACASMWLCGSYFHTASHHTPALPALHHTPHYYFSPPPLPISCTTPPASCPRRAAALAPLITGARTSSHPHAYTRTRTHATAHAQNCACARKRAPRRKGEGKLIARKRAEGQRNAGGQKEVRSGGGRAAHARSAYRELINAPAHL